MNMMRLLLERVVLVFVLPWDVQKLDLKQLVSQNYFQHVLIQLPLKVASMLRLEI